MPFSRCIRVNRNAPIKLSKDSVVKSLFKARVETQPDPTHARGQMHCSRRPVEAVDEDQAKKR